VPWRAHLTALTASVRVRAHGTPRVLVPRLLKSMTRPWAPPRVEAAARRAGVPGRKWLPVASARQSSLAFPAIVGCVARWLHVPTVSSERGMATAFLTAAAATGESGRSHLAAAFRWCTLSRPAHACHFPRCLPPLCRPQSCKMKFKPTVSSSRRKGRKAHFASDSESRRILMSTHLSKDLREKHNVRTRSNAGCLKRAGRRARFPHGVWPHHPVGCPQSGTL
jgi:hypothetical protein